MNGLFGQMARRIIVIVVAVLGIQGEARRAMAPVMEEVDVGIAGVLDQDAVHRRQGLELVDGHGIHRG